MLFLVKPDYAILFWPFQLLHYYFNNTAQIWEEAKV